MSVHDVSILSLNIMVRRTHLVGRLGVVRRELEVRGDVAHAMRGVLRGEGPRRGGDRRRDADREQDGGEELAGEHAS